MTALREFAGLRRQVLSTDLRLPGNVLRDRFIVFGYAHQPAIIRAVARRMQIVGM
jgi:hypothetical protein